MIRRKIGSTLAACGIVMLLFGMSALPALGAAPSSVRMAPSPRPALAPVNGSSDTVLMGHITGTIIDLSSGAPSAGVAVSVGGALVWSDANGNYDHWLPIGTYDSLWARYLEDRGATAVFVGITLSLYGIPFAIASGWGGRMVDRIGPMAAVRRAMWVIVPMIALYGRLAQPWAIGALGLVEATANAVAFPAATTAMALACPPDQLAAGQGLSSAASQLAAGAAAFAAAPAYAAVGSEWTFGGVALVMVAILVIAIVLARPTRASIRA